MSKTRKNLYWLQIKNGEGELEIRPKDSYNLLIGTWEASVVEVFLTDSKQVQPNQILFLCSKNCGLYGNYGLLKAFEFKKSLDGKKYILNNLSSVRMF